MAPITQKQAHEYKARAAKLQKLIDRVRLQWLEDRPCRAIVIGRVDVTPIACAQIETARRLRHAVTVTVDNGSLVLWADPLNDEP